MTNDSRREMVQLPIWPEAVRGGPNAILRSALFAGIASKKRKVLGTQIRPEKEPEGVEIVAQGDDRIRYAGTQLNQYDADVFFEALHLARRHPLETECMFTGHSFLKAIGRATNDLCYEDLEDSLRRLNRGTVEIEWKTARGHFVFEGHLISDFTREKQSKLYKVTFAKEIRTLFAPASWTQLEWAERMALRGGPLAQWLHSYFSTHAVPLPVSVEYLHKLSGSNRTVLKGFGTDLRAAMDRIHEQIGWEFTWAGDLVTVTRPPSGTQVRHLARLTAKRDRAAAVERHAKTEARKARGLTKWTDVLPDLFKPDPHAAERQRSIARAKFQGD